MLWKILSAIFHCLLFFGGIALMSVSFYFAMPQKTSQSLIEAHRTIQ